MCVIYLAYGQLADTPLVLLANRDEFYDRPTLPAASWEDHPHVFGGRDLAAGGTWLAVSNSGRIAAVTNYRDPGGQLGTRSRGKLVSDFVSGVSGAREYLSEIESRKAEYSGFNLLVGEFREDRSELLYFSNRSNGIRALSPGLYGLSNHLLDSQWPKVTKGKAMLSEILGQGLESEAMFDLLGDRELATDEELPDTGIGLERERALSPIFIATPNYGTRCSTVVIADHRGRFEFEERVFV